MKDIDKTISQDPNTELAHNVAKEMGFENGKELMDTTIANMKSKNPAVAQKARAVAAEFTKQLALLILYQEIEKPSIPAKYNWAEKFNDEMIAQGNSKEFIAPIYTGNGTYNDAEFIPTKATSPIIETKIISMYIEKADGTRELAPNAYRYRKTLTINEAQWVPYFMAGKLGEFVGTISAMMRTSYRLFIINKMQDYIKNLNYTKTVPADTNANADMFSCFANEIIPAIEEMQYLNTEYNLGNSKYIVPPSSSDILVFMNNKIKSKLRTGVMSRLFNSHLISLDEVIPKDNWIGTAGAVSVGDDDTAVSIGADWIDEDTVYVLDKNAIRHCLQIDRTESQAWAQNMTLQIVLHIWGTVGDLPWNKGFKYTSSALKVLPN